MIFYFVNSFDEIKNHKFFDGIDFDKVFKKNIFVPFRPKLQGEMDLKYFDISFTEEHFGSFGEEKKVAEKNEAFDGFSFCREEEVKEETKE